MKIKCDYCGNYIEDYEEKCPSCGSVNKNMTRVADGIPKTIEELQSFCKERQLPLEKMRFFIGEDHKGARAFGIYRDSKGDFVVYKNKADGQRAVRYEGRDEAYAVNEIYQKLKTEILNQSEKQHISKKNESAKRSRRVSSKESKKYSSKDRSKVKSGNNDDKLTNAIIIGILIFIVVLLVGSCAHAFDVTPDAGYYKYDEEDYYNDYSRWYEYNDESKAWIEIACPQELYDNYKDFYIAPPIDSKKTVNADIRGTYPPYSKPGNSSYEFYYDESDKHYHFYDVDYDYYYYSDEYYKDKSSSSYYYDDDDDYYDDDDNDYDFWDDDDWDDDDWDYDYDSWDSYDSDWDSDW